MIKLHLKTTCITLTALVLHSCSPAPIYADNLMPIRWTADGSKPVAAAISLAQGETRDLICTLKNYGQAVSIPDSATAFMWYQTNGMDSLYFPGGAATVTTGGVVRATWTPALDVGSSAYSFAIDIKVGSNTVYTPYGTIRMRKTPGWVVNELPQPWRSIDFDIVEILNPPWATPTIISNMIAGIESGGGTIVVEVDPEAKPIAEEALALARGALPVEYDPFISRWTFPPGHLFFGQETGDNVKISANYFKLGSTNDWLVFNNAYAHTRTAVWLWPDTPSLSPLVKRDEQQAAISAATNAAISSIFELQNALLVVSNEVATIQTNGVVIWSSTSGGGSVPPSVTNELWSSISALQLTVSSLQSSLAGITRDWGSFAPDGSANPDPDYMLYINRPATVWASGFQWSTSGGHAVLSTTGMVAFAVGDSGEMRIGPGDGTNYFGFVQGGSVEVGARAEGLTVAGEVATILYPHDAGAFPVLWFTPDLAIPFEPIAGVVWVDNADGTATVTAPATTSRGFWRATTSATYTAEFRSTMPARFTGGVWGATNAVPVIYDSTIQISSGGKTYRIPAEEL